jgi:hypothetical protein
VKIKYTIKKNKNMKYYYTITVSFNGKTIENKQFIEDESNIMIEFIREYLLKGCELEVETIVEY